MCCFHIAIFFVCIEPRIRSVGLTGTKPDVSLCDGLFGCIGLIIWLLCCCSDGSCFYFIVLCYVLWYIPHHPSVSYLTCWFIITSSLNILVSYVCIVAVSCCYWSSWHARLVLCLILHQFCSDCFCCSSLWYIACIHLTHIPTQTDNQAKRPTTNQPTSQPAKQVFYRSIAP